MRRLSTWSLVLLAACKAQVDGAPGVDGAADDAAPDASRLGPWGQPMKLDVAGTVQVEDDVTLSSNTLELFFAISGANGKDLYVTTRASTTQPWTQAKPVSFNSASESDETPRLSADDRTLYFATGRAGNGALDIYKTTRPAAGSTAWSEPVPVMPVNTTDGIEKWFMPCGVDHYVMVRSLATGDSDLVEGTIGGATAAPIVELNSTGNETGTFVSPDCLTILFASTRVKPTKMFRSHRASATAKWDAPSPIDDFPIPGGDGNQEDPWVSSDSRTFAFASDAAGANNKDIYLSTR